MLLESPHRLLLNPAVAPMYWPDPFQADPAWPVDTWDWSCRQVPGRAGYQFPYPLPAMHLPKMENRGPESDVEKIYLHSPGAVHFRLK